MAVLTGTILENMILESFSRINVKVDYLNDINVFPVPDGDTGLNLYITMNKVVEELEKQDGNHTVKTAAKAIAKGAFIGAKGNSGVILSQFFVGFAKRVENEDFISPKIFAEALIEGSDKAYKAVMNPREGTILTVCRETAQAALEKAEEGADWQEMIEYSYEIAQKSTLDTPNLLDNLKEAGVVDAGALGFVYLIQGWLFVISNSFRGPMVLQIDAKLENLHNSADIVNQDLNYQFCTEAAIQNAELTVDDLRVTLSEFGDSLLVIENEGDLKLHIHTNKPLEALRASTKSGKLKSIKIDDMRAQSESHDN